MSSATDFLSNVTDLAVARVRRLIPQFSWAVVTGIDPLQIRLDGSSAPMHTKPGTLVPTLRIGDRVQVLLAGQRATVIGVAGGGDSGWQPLDLESGWTPGNQPPMWRTLGGEVQMRGAIVGPVTTSLQDVATGLPAPVSGAIPRFATIGQAGRIGGIEVNGSGILRFQSQNSPLPTWLGIDCVRYARA